MIFNNFSVIDFEPMDIFLILFGIGFGLLIAMFAYIFIVLHGMKAKSYIVKSKSEGLTEEQIDEKIKFAQDVFSDKNLRGELSQMAHCKDVCTSLVMDIASVYFPNSKRPLLELSVDEVLMLGIYISNRVNDILDHKGVRLFKKIKISTIMGMSDTKKNIDESALMKAAKRYKLKGAFDAVKGALNVVNPIYWARKVIVAQTMDYAISKICLMVIGITAEETYKIYSKNVFNKDVVIEDKYNKLADEISNDLKEISSEEIDSYQEVEDEEQIEQ
ncbi:MAG: hypothetical protein R3Y05_04165 [bacterium]